MSVSDARLAELVAWRPGATTSVLSARREEWQAMACELQNRRQADAWRDIESAPKDITVLLDWPEISGTPVVGWWHPAYGAWQAGNYFCGRGKGKPRAWHPLPPPGPLPAGGST
jgi:hypothetical protein